MNNIADDSGKYAFTMSADEHLDTTYCKLFKEEKFSSCRNEL